MKVTLKKASEIARAAIAAGSAIDIKKTTTVSVFSDIADIPTRVAVARQHILEDIQRACALISVGYSIRAEIGAENVRNGVNDLLSQVAKLDKQLAVYSFSDKPDHYNPFGAAVGTDDMVALIRRLERAATNTVGTHTGDDLVIDLVNEGTKSMITDMVADLKRQRVALKDQITALNFTSHVLLNTDDVELLKQEKIL